MREKPVRITDTTLRDAHQSLWATRMQTQDILPILEKLDKVGYHSLEMWGGATFDVPLRFLNENPWDRIRIIKDRVKKTPLQMLLRGQNLVGYKHYPDDIVKRFIHHAKRQGIDIFRIFDALNDTRNLKVAIEAVKEVGGHVQAAVCYTISPVHTLEHYLETAKEMVKMGADSICIKDMAALLTPYETAKLVKKFKEEINLPLQLHCHYIGGMAPMNYIKAVEAGVDIIDTATVPLAFGNSQPAVEMVVAALKETDFDTGLDLNLLYEIAEYFEKVRAELGFKRGVTSLTQMKVFSHQVPGGMISNLSSQLEEQKALDRLPEVLEEIPKVRAEVGYPPLVTPLSQIVGTQAVLNVLSGKRWAIIPDEMKAYVKGFYGRPPGPMDLKIEKKILSGEKRITSRPADLIKEDSQDFAKEISDLTQSEEDILSYALFPKETREYLERRKLGKKTVFVTGKEVKEAREREYLDIKEIKKLLKAVARSDLGEVVVEEDGIKVTLRKEREEAGEAGETGEAGEVEEAKEVEKVEKVKKVEKVEEYPNSWRKITAPMVGTFYRAPAPGASSFVEVGDKVEEGQTLCILEAMKLMNEITAEEKGVIKKILVENGHPVEYDQVLFLYEPIK